MEPYLWKNREFIKSYSRFSYSQDGKQHHEWKSLKTDNITTAQLRLRDQKKLLNDRRATRKESGNIGRRLISMKELIEDVEF